MLRLDRRRAHAHRRRRLQDPLHAAQADLDLERHQHRQGARAAGGRPHDAGRAGGLARRSEDKSRIYAYEQARRAELDPAQEAEFRKHRKAWKFFEAQPPGYRHLAAWHVVSAKRPETRQARLARLIEASASGLRL
ncbi:YdeI/OmpD-associated family protein [uncultured Methylibium sp.]|uniref:YdeI/OmpD-associated family protein n=1 Tax=uncultured Methylibium sp. TaxID=381093 RepID=UPI0034531E18